MFWAQSFQPSQSPRFFPVCCRAGRLNPGGDEAALSIVQPIHRAVVLKIEPVPLGLSHGGDVERSVNVDLSDLLEKLHRIEWRKARVRNGTVFKYKKSCGSCLVFFPEKN